MPSDTDGDLHPSSHVERMLNALDEVHDAVHRLAAESRTTGRRDLAIVEPFSREERLTLKQPIPRP